MRHTLWSLPVMLAVFLSFLAPAEDSQALTMPSLFANNDGPYVGGRGLITNEGPTGMFLNPTSGTQAKGGLTAQFFATSIEPRPNKDQFAWYNAMSSYGITDWLEAGAIAQLLRVDNNNDTQSLMTGGPFARLRLWKDQNGWPEVSIGGILLEGNKALIRRTIFAAASKRFDINPAGFARGVRVHVGGRQFWQDASVKTGGDSAAYLGGELEMPKNIYFVSEVQTKEFGNRYTPWSAGLQLRHPSGYGLSLSVLQFGFQSSLTGYIGIGINFQ